VYKVKYFAKNSVKELVDYLDELCIKEEIRRSNVIVDEDGVGGGVVDTFVGCKGFVNNSRPVENKYEKKRKKYVLNFANLKAQAYYACADSVNLGKVGVYKDCPSEFRNKLIEDLEQVKRKNPDRDEKIRLVGKDDIKEIIGRSPDFGDAFAMRFYFELKPRIISALI